MQIINGKSISLGSTSPMRDFNFISDTVDGIISVLEKKNLLERFLILEMDTKFLLMI